VRNGAAMRRRHILLTAVVVAGAVAPDATAAWHAPVPRRVVSGFDYRRSAPFERGARRGVRFAAEAGETVRAACPGIVGYAGHSPSGDVVTIRCGELVATHLGLANTRTRTGDRVGAGEPIGRAGSQGVGLGARVARDRWGYVDPLRLFAPAAPGLGPAPVPVRREPLRPRAARRPAARHAPEQRPAAPPAAAWLGLALVAATLAGVGGGTVRRRWGPSTSRQRSTTSMPRRI
jgi:hypothetical protein